MFCQLAARVSFMSADESGQRAMTAFWGIVPCRELRFADRMLRPACAFSRKTPARRRNKAFASLSRKAAGPQGRALSRPSQRAKSPFETRCPTRVSIKLSFSARPQTRNSLRPMAAHENQPADWFSVLRLRRTLTISFPDQSGGLEVPLRRGTENKGWTTYGFPLHR